MNAKSLASHTRKTLGFCDPRVLEIICPKPGCGRVFKTADRLRSHIKGQCMPSSDDEDYSSTDSDDETTTKQTCPVSVRALYSHNRYFNYDHSLIGLRVSHF